ncbi:MAG: hypothetical protein IIC62_06115, partial [Proteobacteria bacterium]|nr:hypothetical protein [Pseudomonadota bacterium]
MADIAINLDPLDEFRLVATPASDRLPGMLFLAALVHGILIIGITFNAALSDQFAEAISLEVTIVANPDQRIDRPDRAEYLAQVSQLGGGNTSDQVRPSAPEESQSAIDNLGQEQGDAFVDSTDHVIAADEVLATQQPQDLKLADSPRDDPQPDSSTALALQSGTDFTLPLPQEDQATLLIHDDDPRQLIVSADTRESKIAGYLDSWKRRIEAVGDEYFPELGDLEGLALTDALHQTLAGSFMHALLEWTAFALAIFTVALAFAHFGVHRDVATPIIGLALFLAGSVDAFHTLAATRLIPAVADNARFIPFTWAISRTFHAVIAIVGVSIFLLGGKRAFRYSPRFLLVTSVAFVLFAYLTIQITAASPQLPVTEFPDSIVKRPYDVPALILFLIAGVFVYPRFLAQRQSVFAHALLIGVIPEVTTQLHMGFQSQAL